MYKVAWKGDEIKLVMRHLLTATYPNNQFVDTHTHSQGKNTHSKCHMAQPLEWLHHSLFMIIAMEMHQLMHSKEKLNPGRQLEADMRVYNRYSKNFQI